jgi:hypothetical protein
MAHADAAGWITKKAPLKQQDAILARERARSVALLVRVYFVGVSGQRYTATEVPVEISKRLIESGYAEWLAGSRRLIRLTPKGIAARDEESEEGR